LEGLWVNGFFCYSDDFSVLEVDEGDEVHVVYGLVWSS
jgi:hypothetical protein